MNNKEKNVAKDNLVEATLKAEGMLQNLRNQSSLVLVQRTLDDILEAIYLYKKIK